MMKESFKNISFPPYVFSVPSVSQMSIYMIIAFLPHIVLLVLSKSYASLILLLVTSISALLCETLYGFLKKKATISDGTALLCGLLIGMFLPDTFPLWLAAITTISSLYITKLLFGGVGCGWVHPAMFAVAVAYICYSSFFPEALITGYDVQSNGTAFNAVLSTQFVPHAQDSVFTGTLNSSFLSTLGIQIPDGYISLFWDTQSSIPAFRFNIATLVSSLFLFASAAVGWFIPLIFLATYSVLVYFFSLIPFGGMLAQGDILFALLTGGVLFTAFFVLQYHGTVPLSHFGKVCYGVLSGICAFALCGIGGSVIGIVFTVLIMNCVSLLIEIVEQTIRSLQKGVIHEI